MKTVEDGCVPVTQSGQTLEQTVFFVQKMFDNLTDNRLVAA